MVHMVHIMDLICDAAEEKSLTMFALFQLNLLQVYCVFLSEGYATIKGENNSHQNVAVDLSIFPFSTCRFYVNYNT